MRRLLWLCVAMLGAGAVLLGAGFWDKKEFTEWSDREVAHMMENSPWSRQVNIVMPGRPGFGDGGGGSDASRSGMPGGGGGRGGRGGGGLGESELSRPPLTLYVRWLSALPVKQALVRSSMSSEQQVDERSEQFLNRVESHYLITVSGIPNRMLNAAGGAKGLTDVRIDRGKDREPLTPENVEARPEQNRVTVYFFFPRTDPIALEEKNVEFVLKAENLNVKKKFKLQDMMYHGKLEL